MNNTDKLKDFQAELSGIQYFKSLFIKAENILTILKITQLKLKNKIAFFFKKNHTNKWNKNMFNTLININAHIHTHTKIIQSEI